VLSQPGGRGRRAPGRTGQRREGGLVPEAALLMGTKSVRGYVIGSF